MVSSRPAYTVAAPKATSPLPPIARTSSDRLQEATGAKSTEADVHLDEKLISTQPSDFKSPKSLQETTVLYLAYGSNLSAATFRGRRGIQPLSQINVYVPELRLTFNLAGLPYIEPCFAGSQYRAEKTTATTTVDAKAQFSIDGKDYHKDRWHKPLIGVVYEVSLKDYARIIATEGAGNGYKDVVVTCYPFPKDYDPSLPTPRVPGTAPFLARTLLSPWKPGHTRKDPRMRPDPSYAQPSARYLKLITGGAEELDLPHDYRAFLADLRPYRITTWKQKVGQMLFLSIWAPIMLLFLALTRVFANDKGIMPPWLARAQTKAFKTMWRTYDVSFRPVFGDGERTISDL